MTLKGQQGEQLRLLMRPSEIMGSVKRSRDAADYGMTQQELWPRKEAEARQPRGSGHGSGVYDSVKAEGLTSHVNLKVSRDASDADYEMGEGAHRVAAAAAVERDTGKDVWVPVHHVYHGDRGWEYGPEYDRTYPQNVRKGWGPGG